MIRKLRALVIACLVAVMFAISGVAEADVTIQGTGCPSAIILNQPFVCTPAITESLTEAEKAGAVYTWTSSTGTLTQSSTDIINPILTLTGVEAGAQLNINFSAYYPAVPLAKSGSQIVSAVRLLADMTCPSRVWENTPFTCTISLSSSDFDIAYADSIHFQWNTYTAPQSNLIAGESYNSPVYTATINNLIKSDRIEGNGYFSSPTGPLYGNRPKFASPGIIAVRKASITSISCPARIIENEGFTCQPQVSSSDVTQEELAGAVYTWSSDTGTLTQSDNSSPTATLKLTGGTNANPKITVNITYPNADNKTITKDTTVPYSFVRVASLGCLNGIVKPPFSCSPLIESSLTEAEQAGAVYTWTTDNGAVTAEHTDVPWGNINIVNYENKTTNLTLYATYPNFGGRTISGAIAMQLNSVATDYQPVCPVVVKKGQTIVCAQTPSVTSGVSWLPPDYAQTGANPYSTLYDASFVFAESGEKEILVKYSGITQKNINVIVTDATYNATNCPAEVYANEPFRCNPTVTTFPVDYPKTANELSWDGAELQVNPDGSLQYNTVGTKTITGRYNSNHYANPEPPAVTAEFPASLAAQWGESYTRWNITKEQNIVVKNRTMSVTSVGCPTNVLSTKSFTCAPVISTDIPAELRKDVAYTWSGDGLVVNSGNVLRFTTNGTKTIIVNASYPGIDAETVTGTVNVTVPQITETSLTCPENVFAEESFRCSGDIVTNLPEQYKTEATKTWTADGLIVNEDGSMKFTTDGPKTATLTLAYPLADFQTTHEKTFNVIKPTLAVTSLNCPAEVLANEQFTCAPEFTTNLPENYQANIQKTWTGTDVAPKSNNYVTFTATGQKTLNVRFDYPGVEPVNTTANITVWGSTVNITSLGCPAELKTQESFRCAPVIETDMSQAYQDKLTYTWTGSSMEMADDGSMAMTASGNKGLTLVVALPEKNLSFKKTESINVVTADTTITSLGCPAASYFGSSFACAPEIETTGDVNNFQYAWSGADLNTGADGKMVMAQSGAGKKITLTVTNPETGLRVQKTESMNVTPIVVSIEGHGCSTKIKGMQPFKCAPPIRTNVSGIKDGLNYTWSGQDLFINENGSLLFKGEGSKTVSLRVTHPDYPQVNVEKSFALDVTGLSLEVVNLGCSKNITEYVYISCTPKISSDLTSGEMVYDWQLNGESVGAEKNIKLLTKAPGTSTVSLSVKIVDPETKMVATESSLSQEITVAPNTGKLRLYVSAPGRAEKGTSVTLEAKSIFQVEEIMDYTWIVNGIEYKGKVITVPVPATQVEPIAYSVTAKPNCCEGIIAETREGVIKTTEYKFPNIAFSGPSNATINVAPFEATFKTAVVTTSNLTYTWDFGDGSPLEVTDKTTTRMKHIYANPGAYTAKLSVKDMNNDVREFQADITVMPLPERELDIKSTMSNAYNRRPVTGYFKYGIGGGLKRDTPVSSSWSINDEVISEKSSARIDFSDTGTHTVNLEVKTKYGNVLHESATVEVKENLPPQCLITKEPFGAEKYKLTANCTDPDGKVVRYKWDLGGGASCSSSRAYLSTKIAGDYPVSLTATDDSGDTVTVNDTVSVSGNEVSAGE